MKALIAGGGGQLGQELLETAPLGVEVRALGRSHLDITDPGSVSRALGEFGPNVIINCAAYTGVDQAESDRNQAFAVNADAAGHLARRAGELGARLVHVSTDFVFEGASGRPYRSTDATRPINVYGASKLAGERLALAAAGDVVVVRGSWLYSRFGANFVKTMLRLLAERDEVRVVADQFGSPTWARGLAEALWCAAQADDLTGLLHWSDLGSASWYDFAVAIRDEALSRGLLEQETPIRAVPTKEFPTEATRPPYSVLESDEVWETYPVVQRPWRDGLRRMLDAMKAHLDE